MTRGGLLAVSPQNGALLWRHNRFAGMSTPETTTAHGNSPVYADGRLYCLGENGNMGLLEANPAAFRLVSTFPLAQGEGPCWTHPVISDGKLFLRWNDTLCLYDIKKWETPQ
jgi:outer membrane protein assembly factor BamB